MTSARMKRGLRRAAVLAPLVGIVLQLGAGPVTADPAVPTHYRSTVTEVVDAEGDPVDLDVEVLGGDTYLVVEVPAGVEVEVPGYDDEPYIRFGSDGEVEVNQRSPARWLNDARYGSAEVDLPPSADAEAPPDWGLVSRSGTYAWHDHRIHFMSPRLPPQVDSSLDEVQEVWPWEVPLIVDGAEVVIHGELAWVPGPGPVVPVLALIIATAVAVLAARSVGPDPLIGVAALLTIALGVSSNLGLPPGADRLPALWVLPAVSIGVLLIGRMLSRGDDLRGAVLRALSAVPPAGGAVLMIGALVRPIVPGLFSPVTIRTIVIAILALSIASLIVVVRQIWASTSLDREEPAVVVD